MNPDFYDYLQEHYAIKTQQNYLRSMRYLENEGVDLDTRTSFKEWAIRKKNKGTKDRTINMYLRAYNAYLDFRHLPRYKPYKTFDSVRRDRASVDDYYALIEACRGYTAQRDRLMVEVLFKGGLRYAEMIALGIDDITEEKIVVQAGKNQKYREVPLFPSVYEAYRKYLPFRKALIEKANRNTLALFVSQYGEPVTQDGGRNAVYRIAKRAGIEFSPHRARRFYGRYLWEQGIKTELIQRVMGHEKIDTTLTYIAPDATDAFNEMRREMKKLDFSAPSGRGERNSHHMLRPERELVHVVHIGGKPHAAVC